MTSFCMHPAPFAVALAVAAAAAAGTPPAHAQDEGGWDTEFTFSYDLNRGNSDTDAFRIGAKTDHKRERDEILLEARYDYGKADDVKNVENAYAVADYNYVFGRALYTNVKAEYLYDDIADIQYRVLAAPPALGYFFIRNEKTRLSGELGVAWLWEEVGGITDDYPALRLKQRYEHDFNESVSVFQLVEYTPELGSDSRHLVRFEAGVDSALMKLLHLRVHLVDRYDSDPAEDAEKNVVSLNVGLVLKV